MLAWLMAACTDLALWAANQPVNLSGITVSRDVVFDASHALALDIYQPEDSDNAPVIIFFYGGGWIAADKADYQFIAASFARAGYVVAIPNYRVYPEVTFPKFIEDAASATAWVKQNINRYGGDAARLFVMGHSAGAYNAAMMLADAKYLNAHGMQPSDINAFVGLAGPYNFKPTSQKYRKIFNEMQDFSSMKVGSYISGDEPPMYLLHGHEDGTVAIENAQTLAETIRSKDGHVQTRYYDDINHYSIIGIFTNYFNDKAGIRSDILRFLQAQ